MRSILLQRGGLLSVLVVCNKATFSAAFFSHTNASKVAASTSRMAASAEDTTSRSEGKTIRVLALHGSEGNAKEFPSRLKPLEELLQQEQYGGVKLEITAVQAPFAKGPGFAWWTMPPGVRSYTAGKYEGFETSASKVLDVWNSQQFDLVLGHSQGAILIASLIALGKTPYHPSNGYVLNGCGYCSPFAAQVESLKIISEQQDSVPRCLFIIGVNDKVTPSTIQEKLRDGFQTAGLEVSTSQHPKGHGFPKDKDHFMHLISEWILGNSS
jgi:predicted esterase